MQQDSESIVEENRENGFKLEEKKYNNINKTTIDTSLCSFQYKFLMRILPTNKRLFKYKIKETNLCDFCQSNIETTDHLFWECQHIQHLWSQLQNYIREKNINHNFTKSEAFLGTCNHIKSNVINFLTLLMRFYIFSCKYK